MTVFHNLCRDHHEINAPPLDCARSGDLHTICSVVTQEMTSSPRLRLLSNKTGQLFTQTGLTALPSRQQHLQTLRPQGTPLPPASAGLFFLQIAPVPSGFHAVVRILNILRGVRARFI